MARRLLDFFVFGNILIAFASLCLTLTSQVILFHKLSYHPYLPLIFFATWFVYNSHRVWGIFKAQIILDQLSYRDQWAFQNRTFMYANTLFSLTGLMVYAFLCQLRVGLLMAPLAILALGYTFPIIGRNIGMAGLRAIPVLKTILIASVWAVVTVFVPVVFYTNVIDKNSLWLLAERFLFVFAITLPFEMRDIAEDKAVGIKTIAVLLGFKHTLTLAKILILCFWIVCIIHYSSDIGISTAMVLSAFSAWVLIKNTESRNSEYFYLFWLDSTMILQFLLVFSTCIIRML